MPQPFGRSSGGTLNDRDTRCHWLFWENTIRGRRLTRAEPSKREFSIILMNSSAGEQAFWPLTDAGCYHPGQYLWLGVHFDAGDLASGLACYSAIVSGSEPRD